MSTTIFKLSQLSMTMIEGVISAWHKQIGDAVQEGEPLLEVETDKMVKDITAPATGYLVKLCAQPGDIVPVDGELCVISDDPNWSDDAASMSPSADASTPSPAPAAVKQNDVSSGPASHKIRISPLAKRIAQLDGVDYSHLAGTGPGGTIVKRDILEAAKCPPASVSPSIPQTQTSLPGNPAPHGGKHDAQPPKYGDAYYLRRGQSEPGGQMPRICPRLLYDLCNQSSRKSAGGRFVPNDAFSAFGGRNPH